MKNGRMLKEEVDIILKKKGAYVYLLKAGDCYKVGVARDIESRIRDLQCGCPHPIRLVASFPCRKPYALEADIHDALHLFSTSGEWFCAKPRPDWAWADFVAT